MTRVSDRAAFALAVAEGGGLPFLALALMTGDEVRRLLTETSELLGDLPWGVGILGFTPPEVRAGPVGGGARRPPAVRPHRRRPTLAGGTPGGGRHRHLPARPLARPARPLPAGGRPPVRVRGLRVRRPRRPPGQLPPVGHPDRAPPGHARRPARPARSLRRRHRRRAVGGHGRGRGRAPVGGRRHGRRPHGDRLPVHRGGGGRGRHPPRVPAGGGRVPGDGAAGDVARPRHPVRPHALRRGLRRGPPAADGRRRVPTGHVGRAGAAQPGPAADRVQGPQAGRGPAGDGRRGRAAAGRDVHDRPGGGPAGRRHHHRRAPRPGHRGGRRLPRRPGVGPGPRRRPTTDAADAARPLDVAIVGMACVYPGAPDAAAFWANVVAGVDSVTEVPATRWDPDLYYDKRLVQGPPGPDPVEVGRLHPRDPLRRPRLRHPAVVAGGHRAGAAPRPRGGGPGPGRRRLRQAAAPSPATARR